MVAKREMPKITTVTNVESPSSKCTWEVHKNMLSVTEKSNQPAKTWKRVSKHTIQYYYHKKDYYHIREKSRTELITLEVKNA
jgi:hypothetical protein